LYSRLVRFGFTSISGTLPRTKDIRHLAHVRFRKRGDGRSRGRDHEENRRTYQPRVFDNAFEVVFDAMRELIEDLWPERLYKCRKGEALNAA
jgi:hypothetical protein